MNKTKFFSSLLVAVLFATTSVFVSCKDYDDDIKNLQSQIDKAALKADLDALSTKLAGVESTANAAKTTAENALAKANANKTEIDNVKATADKAAADAADALKKVATAQSTAEAAQAAADGAKTLAENAQKAADAAQATANAAQAAADAAQATANAAATKKDLEDAVKKVEDAAKALSDAAATKTELADAKTELKAYTDAAKAAALKTAEAAATAAEKALTDAKGYTDAEVVKINDNIKTLATQAAVEKLSKDLNDEITGLKNTLAAITDEEKMAELVKIVGSFDTIVETLFRAVTSVELLASYSGTLDDTNEAVQFPLSQFLRHQDQGSNLYLPFYFGKQKFTSKFGDKETESLFKDADEIIEYTEGVDIRAKQALLVRVNPVNATFTKEDVKLIDSKGRNLDEIITIGDPYRYEGLITRGATTETGLWVIPVSVKENTQLKDFNVVTYNEREYYTVETYKQDNAGATDEDAQEAVENNAIRVPGDGILYAVAINNTADEADGRFVASTYDVEAQYVNFEPESTISFFLTTENSKGEKNEAYWYNIHNRWAQGNYINSYTNEGNKPGILSWDQKNSSNKSLTAYTLENPEQAWSLSSDAKKAGWSIPVDVAKKSQNDDEKVYDTANDGDDYRYARSFFYIEKVGQKITVELPDYYKTKAEYWYITYDFQANAVESAPSEWEAWKSYQDGIKGIYTMTRGAQTIDLVINKAEAQGDVIGFRVWAVNYDGSLLDPDGKAFYVKVGEEPEAQKLEITAEFMAVNADADMALTYTRDQDKTYTAAKGYNVSTITAVSGNEFESLTLSSSQAYNILYVNSKNDTKGYVPVYYALLKDAKTLASNWNEVKFIKVGVPGSYLNKIKDGATLTLPSITGNRTDANNKEKYEIVIKVTKKMPDAAWTTENHYKNKFTWKSDYNPATGELTVYPKAIATNQHTPYYDATSDPKKFYWNNTNALVEAYGTADWTKVANDAQRMIKDYLSSTTLSETQLANYSFKLKALPTTLTGSGEPTTADYFAKWNVYVTENKVDTAGATMMTVEPVAIGNSYNAELNYTYKNISLTGKTVDEVWVWNDTYDYPVAIDAFKKVTFKDAMDLNDFVAQYPGLSYYVDGNGNVIKKMANGEVPAATTATKVEKPFTNLYIKWESNFKNKNVDVAVSNALFKAVKKDFGYKNADAPETTFDPATYEPTVAGDLEPLADANLRPVLVTTTKDTDAARVLMRDAGITVDLSAPVFKAAWFKFKKDNNGAVIANPDILKFEITGDAATYLKVGEGATLTSFKFARTGYNKNANPQVNISGAIKISGMDVFGHARSFEIPFIIKHNL